MASHTSQMVALAARRWDRAFSAELTVGYRARGPPWKYEASSTATSSAMTASHSAELPPAAGRRAVSRRQGPAGQRRWRTIAVTKIAEGAATAASDRAENGATPDAHAA